MPSTRDCRSARLSCSQTTGSPETSAAPPAVLGAIARVPSFTYWGHLWSGASPPEDSPLRTHKSLLTPREVTPQQGAAPPALLPGSRPSSPGPLGSCAGPTNAGYLLSPKVTQQGLDRRVVPGVQLVPVDADVEFEPVGVGVDGRLPRGGEFLILGSFAGPTANEGDRSQQGGTGAAWPRGEGAVSSRGLGSNFGSRQTRVHGRCVCSNRSLRRAHFFCGCCSTS